MSPGTLLWRLEIQVADPHGIVSEGTVVNSATNPTTKGTVQVAFCGSEPAGTYTVRATGFYQIIPAVQLPFALPETSFQVRPAATRTALAEKRWPAVATSSPRGSARRARTASAQRTASRSGWSGSCPGTGNGSPASR